MHASHQGKQKYGQFCVHAVPEGTSDEKHKAKDRICCCEFYCTFKKCHHFLNCA